MKLYHKFIKNIPEHVEEGVIYISLDYSTAIHKCCCGCGKEVVTPFSPTDWKLIFDGETITLYPSIGNWNFKCQSHYWVTNNKVEWAPKWDKEQIKSIIVKDRLNKSRYYKKEKSKLLSKFFKKW